jgi:hypothetical protein
MVNVLAQVAQWTRRRRESENMGGTGDVLDLVISGEIEGEGGSASGGGARLESGLARCFRHTCGCRCV